MDLYDSLLGGHVLGAFFAVGALTALWALILGTRGQTPLLDPRSAMAFGRADESVVGVGMMVALVFGIWLRDRPRWPTRSGTAGSSPRSCSGRSAAGRAARPARRSRADRGGREAGIRFQAINSVGVLVILVLMIWKPGA